VEEKLISFDNATFNKYTNQKLKIKIKSSPKLYLT
jgi:hypothetical protein